MLHISYFVSYIFPDANSGLQCVTVPLWVAVPIEFGPNFLVTPKSPILMILEPLVKNIFAG